MKYNNYLESIKNVPFPDDLVFDQAILWLHPEILPLELVSLGNCGLNVIKVPEQIENRYGKTVPVISVARNVFAGNGNITDVILPSSIDSIAQGAFAGCSHLRNITIPKRVKTIRAKTFDGCIDLENVYYEGTEEEWNKMNIVHDKHEIEFGDCIPGSPVQTILAERRVHIPGNDALFTANLHFRCRLEKTVDKSFKIMIDDTDITYMFRKS